MPDWLTWPADLLLGIGGIVTSWFVSRDEASFTGIQTMVTILLLAALVAWIAGGQSLAEFVRSALQVRQTKRHS
jgi:hypothetical protein